MRITKGEARQGQQTVLKLGLITCVRRGHNAQRNTPPTFMQVKCFICGNPGHNSCPLVSRPGHDVRKHGRRPGRRSSSSRGGGEDK
jgi:hypothetical protein